MRQNRCHECSSSRRSRKGVTYSFFYSFQKAFEAALSAFENFQKLPPSQRRLYVAWTCDAEKEETRRRRLGEALERLAKGEKLGMK